MFNNFIIQKLFRWCVLFSTIVFLLSCTTVRSTLNFDSILKLHFSVTEQINPDDFGRSSPLVVRVYELKDSKQFESENFISLYEADKERLGPDFIRRRNLQEFTPGKNRFEELILDNETRFVGLVGEFVQYRDVQFRVIIPVESHTTKKSHVVINSKGLSLH